VRLICRLMPFVNNNVPEVNLFWIVRVNDQQKLIYLVSLFPPFPPPFFPCQDEVGRHSESIPKTLLI
jgi:hypothetical protein